MMMESDDDSEEEELSDSQSQSQQNDSDSEEDIGNRNNRNLHIDSGNDSDVVFDEEKNEMDSSSSDTNQAENDDDPTQSHPDFSFILPSVLNNIGNKTMESYKHIESALESLVDTAQSLAEHNTQTNGYEEQTDRLKSTMHKLLDLCKQKKCEKVLFFLPFCMQKSIFFVFSLS